MTIGLDTTFLVQHDVREAPLHAWARTYLVASVLEAGNTPGLCPQVLAEYLHVITDPARFEYPLTMAAALSRAAAWWSLPGMRGVFPTPRTTSWFLSWMGQHGLGRKRVLDTMLAATYASNGYHCLLSTDRRGFALFDGITVLGPPEAEGTSRSPA